MNKKILVALIIVVILVIVVIVGLAVAKKPAVKSSGLKVGVIDVLSGEKAPIGEDFKNGLDLAMAVYNTAHASSTVELIYKDDGYDGVKGTAAFHELINNDHVDALIVLSSPTMEAIAPEAATLSIPVLAYGQAKGDDAKDSIFRLFSDSAFADKALGIVLKTMAAPAPEKSVVGVYTNDPTLVDFYNAFKESLGANIKDFALDISMDGKASEIKAVAEKVAALNPKFIFMSNYANLGSQFIKHYQSLGKQKPVFVFDLTLNHVLPDYEKALGDLTVLDGSLVVSTPATDEVNFSAQFKTKYNEDPGELAPYGYDALAILVATKDGQGTWIDRIAHLKMKGATGDISFDPNGLRIPALSISTITNGKIPTTK